MGLHLSALQERFEQNVERIPFSTCHYWTGRLNDNGYGVFDAAWKNARAHRIAYELANGPIPDIEGFGPAHILHSCDNPMCVNPEHLRPGTQTENMADAAARNRFPKRLEHHWGVHSDETLDAVCMAVIHGRPNDQITRAFGVSPALASSIRHGNYERDRFLGLGGTPATGRSDRSLSDDAARAIYSSSGTYKDIAARFGTSPATITDIKLGRCYAKVTGARS